MTLFRYNATIENMVKNIDTFLEGLLEPLVPKQRKVLTDRFGLRNGQLATLQQIGDDLGITRERVRQIEEQGLKKLGSRLHDEYAVLFAAANKCLARVGGVQLDSQFVENARQTLFTNANTKNAAQKVKFVFLAAATPFYARENDDTNAFWYSDDVSKKKFFDFLKQSKQYFVKQGKKALGESKTYLAQFKNFSASDFLSISKHFSVNTFGEIGPRAWPEIEPRTVRDKAYLALRRHGEPLHFENIATYINRFGIDQKKAHVQTVHNELIKDKRFVLVGRGMYALEEHGFEPGTVREVIARILKKQGPLSSKEVVSHVKKQRILKENTVLLSLQNRRHFKRLDNGTYHVKEA